MAVKKPLNTTTGAAILIVVVLIIVGLGYKLFLAPKGGAGRPMTPTDVQHQMEQMKQKGITQPSGTGGSTMPMQQGGMMPQAGPGGTQ